MLKANNISKSYNDLQVLKNVELDLMNNEVVSIVGASGAGKSTLLHILGTLDKPDAGSLTINGYDVVALSANKLAKFRNSQLGFVFQFHNLLPEFSAIENVCLPGFISGKPDAEVKSRGKELLEILGIGARANHRPSELSGGEQQRVAVARALINDPNIVFADEPSGNLDSKNAEQLHKLFFDLRDQFKKTFVIVTHNEELAELSDRKVEIKDGSILYA
ncbi:lipoprotein ABC transporter ATP-binding protein [Roseivirga spongicola]|uniref:Lipoprotein ABC transporter ATP-binding protein n=1 Tax=Roseivirga spongicola TaxID=333140 RepID=A0A150X6L8_9BACT|nr:lipoprotein ABC transporter ATP-binding protein [Roseivirga spongicola]MBO6495352.1 ABC transporter ATP-binding protein [Roseivirga sp.]PWL32369.1 MAG: ABC transporter ATP-binding protein [Roseivirga sp. XM-24bin3]MBO6660471.1 ABC transporter ATP-binding protein [Roseivirga sp.]MBO6761385.1 ABC transporter ATP-binding protein [Roseivirga sp.]